MKVDKSKLIGSLYLLGCAMIWGMSFVAQSIGAQSVSAYVYNASRFVIAIAFLLPILVLSDFRSGRKPSFWGTDDLKQRAALIKSGLLCGVFLTLGITFQQVGIRYTTAGKAGFVTALYIVIVPILGTFLKQKVTAWQWGFIFLAMCGFYFISIKGGVTLGRGEMIVFLGSVFLALHIFTVGQVANGMDVLRLSIIRFAAGAVISFVLALLLSPGELSFAAIMPVIKPLLYSGILSSGVAHTLQIVGQKRVKGPPAAMLLSLESVFSVIGGGIVLHESMSPRELFGCLLVFLATILLQLLPTREKEHSQMES